MGNDAELLGFCSGGWLGSGVLSPDDPESAKFSVSGDANGEPLVTDDSDPLGTETFATHRIPIDEAPGAYEMFQHKRDGAIKIVIKP